MRKCVLKICAAAFTVLLLLAGAARRVRAEEARVLSAEGVRIDLRGVPEGVLTFEAEGAFLFRVEKDGEDYRYDAEPGAAPMTVPLQMGEGVYTVAAYARTESGQEKRLEASFDAAFADPYAPFLSRSLYVNWREDGACARFASAACAGCGSETEKARAMYREAERRLTYDYALAERESGYRIADPEEVLSRGSGVCWDYAVLLCAMMRSAGIPAQLAVGHYEPSGTNHAWVRAYAGGVWITADAALGYFGNRPSGYTVERVY